MAEIHVELVSVERKIWSGEATQVIARTTTGEIGILPGHTPLLGELSEGGTVRITEVGGHEVLVAVHGGFLSVTKDGVTLLAEVAELADEIDTARAAADLDKARESGDTVGMLRAESRLTAARGLAAHI